MAQIKRKVTLRQKVSTDSSPKKQWWPWIVGAVVVCGFLVFLLTRNDVPDDDVTQATSQSTENIATIDSSIVSTSDFTESEDLGTPDDQMNPQTEDSKDQTTPEVSSDATPQQSQNNTATGQKTSTPYQTKPQTTQVNTTTPRNVSTSVVNGTTEEEAWRTIRGNYGNGAARKEALGNRYDEIQAKVNDFYREGKVH